VNPERVEIIQAHPHLDHFPRGPDLGDPEAPDAIGVDVGDADAVASCTNHGTPPSGVP
jgi:hypothetical protein